MMCFRPLSCGLDGDSAAAVVGADATWLGPKLAMIFCVSLLKISGVGSADGDWFARL